MPGWLIIEQAYGGRRVVHLAYIKSPAAGTRVGDAGQGSGIAALQIDRVAVQIRTYIDMVGEVLQMNQRGAVPQTIALFGSAALGAKTDDRQIVGGKQQPMYTARLVGAGDAAGDSAGSGVLGGFALQAQRPDKDIHGVVRVLPHQQDVISVFRKIGVIGGVNASAVLGKGVHHCRDYRTAAHRSLVEGVTAGVVEDVAIACVPQRVAVVHARHVGGRDRYVASCIADPQGTVATPDEDQGVGAVKRSVGGIAVGESEMSSIAVGFVDAAVGQAFHGTAEGRIGIALALGRRYKRRPVRRNMH